MNTTYKFRLAIWALILLAVVSLGFKIVPAMKYADDFYAEKMFDVEYQYFFKTNDGKTNVRTYLPNSSDHQRISNEKISSDAGIVFSKHFEGNNLKGVWSTQRQNYYADVSYAFTYKGKSKSFEIPESFKVSGTRNYEQFLATSKYVQVYDKSIDSLAKTIKSAVSSDRQTIKGIFDFVNQIPSAPIISLTDAQTTLKQNRASCNGKSRLLVALSRNLGYPARIKGGIILEEANKRTSHSWVEILINDKWIPFDALNNHFAYLPANYLELYEGDEFLITYTAGINFDYSYQIKKQINIPYLNISAHKFSQLNPVSLWGLVENNVISLELLILLLMIPVGGLLVAFLRIVVGLKTFGVFLPVLIAFSLIEVGFVKGMISFIFLILFVGLITRPINKLGLLHTPKMVVSLSLMILVMMAGSYIGMLTGTLWLTTLSFFPAIILTVSAERFSTLISEDGFAKAFNTFSQTLIAVIVCYLVLSNALVSSVIILFPEVLFIIIALSMFLGRYVGFRITELIRFEPLLIFKKVS